MPDADVVVVGAGPAGAMAALVLARAGRRVLLVDRCAFPRDKACGDLLGTLAIATLRRRGVDLEVVRDAPPLRGAFIETPRGVRFGAALGPRAAARLGARVVPRRDFDAALVQAACAAGAVFHQATATAVLRTAGGAVAGIRCAGGTELRAPLTIGADGWSSVVARAIVDAPRAARDAGIAVRTYVDGMRSDGAMHFAIGPSGDGYGWIFPLPNGRANVGLGFVRDEPGADALHAAFERFLQRPELRGARECGPRKSWPIPFGWRATPVAAPGALLAGDAASLASALSGSGIHTALASGALAADVALEALGSGAAYGRRLAPIARRLQLEALVHRIAGTPATSERAIGVLRRIPGAGRAAAPFLLNLG